MNFLSKSPGIGGRLKAAAEDFIVEEISSDGTVFCIDQQISRQGSGKFAHFVLQKKDWSTSSAILEIAKRLHAGHKRFSYAGTKDKAAITTQLVSAYDMPKEKILSLNIKDIKINGAWNADDKVHLGQLLGNRFTIHPEGADTSQDKIDAMVSELGGKFPNYFGEQRFGTTRKNTHLVGLEILKGNLEQACRIFLCDSQGEENKLAKQARQELDSTGDYQNALKQFPKYLRLERKMIAHLANKPEDYAGAFKAIPRTTLLLFIHAVQSMFFNIMLSDRIGEGIELEEGEYFCSETSGFPDIGKADAEGWVCGKVIGYSTPLNTREKELLGKYGISKDDFRLKYMPEIASKGTYRTLFAPLKDFNYSDGIFRFSLPSGSYATAAMREFMK
jgi:tRNA pseudouridine13 synthase